MRIIISNNLQQQRKSSHHARSTITARFAHIRKIFKHSNTRSIVIDLNAHIYDDLEGVMFAKMK